MIDLRQNIIEFLPRDADAVDLKLLDSHYSSLSEALSLAAQDLSPGKRLVVIADNANALKYLTGAGRDPAGTYVSLKEIKSAGEALGLTIERLYYPLPNAAFLNKIFSDDYLPSPSDFRGISESFTESRYIFADEEALYGTIARSGAFPELAPSYIIVYRAKEASQSSSLPIYAKYNSAREARYQIKTEIFDHNGIKEVVKTALTPEADSHIESFIDKARVLRSERSPLIPLDGELRESHDGRKAITFPYIEGVSLADSLSDKIVDGRAPVDALRDAIELIAGGGERHNLDALFENIIMRGGEYILIDYEWVSADPADPDFIAYRALKYWYEEYRDLLSGYRDIEEFMEPFGLGDTEALKALEESLQSAVRGRALDIERLYTRPQTYAFTPEKHEEIAESLRTIDSLRGEVSGLKKTLAKEREVERLSQNHIRNIEHIREIQAETIERLSRDNEYLLRHESILSRIKRSFISWLDTAAPAGSRKRTYIHLLRHPLRTAGLFMSGRGRLYIKGLLEIGEEFRDGGFLTFPEIDDPLVSVVIPVYNEVAYTYACLRSILKYTDFSETPAEIIIADDGSIDATSHLSDFVSGVVISKNPTNTGFLKNAAQGAARARGRYIFFLNNDTSVHELWLKSLIDRMEGDPAIGLTGSKLVYPDGRLQEAGGIIWSDGSGWNYGRGDDPKKPQYNYLKDADYISGAAIMIRRTLWEEIGGFDERFVPAYCEDSDLAFEVRRRGYRVVYEPLSVITHFEGVSNGTDVEDTRGLKHYQIQNQIKFREKWAAELLSQEDNTGDPDPFTARERSKGRPLVVFIDHYVPTWDRDAGSLTTYQYIRLFLDHDFNVKFVGDNFLHEEPYTTSLEELGVEVLYGDEMRDGIYEWFRMHAQDISVCFLHRPHIAIKYIDFLRELGIKCVFYGHDLHFLRLMREYELSGDIETLSEAESFKSTELSVIDSADISYYPSIEEVAEIKKLRPAAALRAIPGYMWEDFPEAPSGEELLSRRDLLFVGGFRHPPNADALRWFTKEVFPIVRESYPDIRFLVAGSGADEEIMKLHQPEEGVEILGYVSPERLNELYHEARMVVVPLRYGAGVKGKTVEALYFASPIVTTPVGAEGIPDAEKIMIVADAEASALSEAIISAYSDIAGLAELTAVINNYMREHFSPDKAWETIKEDFT